MAHRRVSRRTALAAAATVGSALAGCSYLPALDTEAPPESPGPGDETRPGGTSAGTESPGRTGAADTTATGTATPVAGFEESFERDLSAWTADAHLPADEPFDWRVERTRRQARTGEWSVAIFTEGRHDDGTAWLWRPVAVEPGRRYDVAAAAFFWSAGESFNRVRDAVVHVGPERPRTEAAFACPDENCGAVREPLDQVAGWREYGVTWRTPELATDTLYVSVGLSVVWEADRVHFVDDVAVTLTPVDG